jgi:indolepyruvate ferredoxin oxidoreductase beta subunit
MPRDRASQNQKVVSQGESPMKYDIILAGVGGQGVVSLSSIIAWGGMKEGKHVHQSEVHGMSQRGGSVQATLRVSDQPIPGCLVPQGTASMILAMEPLEALRYLPYLAPNGVMITSTAPIKNIPNYPDLDALLAKIRALPIKTILLDADDIARKSGSLKAANVVMVGAASHALPLSADTLLSCIRETFAAKGEKIVDANIAAFTAGREAGLS